MANTPKRLAQVFQSYPAPVYFVTLNAYRHSPILAKPQLHARFIQFGQAAQERFIAVGRYVIMPTHIHLFVRGPQTFELSSWIRQLKRSLSALIPTERPHWQEGFFDHLLRHSDSYAEKWEYVMRNPVRAQLVPAPEQWPYQGEIVPIIW